MLLLQNGMTLTLVCESLDKGESSVVSSEWIMSSLPLPHLPRIDERQPQCSACQRLGVTCPGPQIRTTFIEEHPSERFRASSMNTTAKSTSRISTSSPKVSTNSSWCMTEKGLLSSSSHSLSSVPKWTLDLPKECYYTSLFVSKFNTEPVGVPTPFSWLHHGLLTYDGNATISDRFAQNLTQAFFGHYFARPEVMNAAQAEHGRNLLVLKSSLDVPEMVPSEDLFRAILTAIIFELITQTSSYAWLMHTLALAKIIQVSKSRHV